MSPAGPHCSRRRPADPGVVAAVRSDSRACQVHARENPAPAEASSSRRLEVFAFATGERLRKLRFWPVIRCWQKNETLLKGVARCRPRRKRAERECVLFSGPPYLSFVSSSSAERGVHCNWLRLLLSLHHRFCQKTQKVSGDGGARARGFRKAAV